MALRDHPEASGLNTAVDYGGQSYHVQTQFSTRDAPIVESIVFRGGESLVRITASYEDIATQHGFSGADGRHLLELQHDDLLRKIRHGMLQDDDDNADASAARVIDSEGATVAIDEIEDQAVLELLHELDVKLDTARQEQPAPAPANSQAALRSQSRPMPSESAAFVHRRPWWRRFAVCIRW